MDMPLDINREFADAAIKKKRNSAFEALPLDDVLSMVLRVNLGFFIPDTTSSGSATLACCAIHAYDYSRSLSFCVFPLK